MALSWHIYYYYFFNVGFNFVLPLRFRKGGRLECSDGGLLWCHPVGSRAEHDVRYPSRRFLPPIQGPGGLWPPVAWRLHRHVTSFHVVLVFWSGKICSISLKEKKNILVSLKDHFKEPYFCYFSLIASSVLSIYNGIHWLRLIHPLRDYKPYTSKKIAKCASFVKQNRT